MNTEYYRIFLECVRTGNLTQAAENLGYTQSGISHIVALLEAEFGFPLLSRSKSGVRLTRDGARIASLMREVINRDEQLRQSASEINGLRSGKLCIGSIESVAVQWLPGLIKRFNEMHPDIEISVIVGDYKRIEDMLTEEIVDCGFISSVTSRQYRFMSLFKDEFVVLFPEGHPLANRESLTLQQVAELDFIVPCEGANYDIGQIFRREGIRLNVKAEINSDYVAIAMVKAGLGVTIMPKLLIKGMCDIGPSARLEPRCFRTIGIAYKNEGSLSPACKAFIGFASAELSSLIDSQSCLR